MSGPNRRMAGSLAVPLALLLVVAGFLLALLAAHVDPPSYATAPVSTGPVAQPAAVPPNQAPPPGVASRRDNTARPLHEVGSLVLGLYIAMIVGALLALVVLVVSALAGRSGRKRRRVEESDSRGYDLQPELVAQRMAEAAAAGLDDLAEERPVADVIIACWQRLRAAAAEAGVPPVASDTPAESIARVLRAGAVSDTSALPLATLAGLYREARFSAHEMTLGDVWVARQALQAIVAELRPETHDAH